MNKTNICDTIKEIFDYRIIIQIDEQLVCSCSSKIYYAPWENLRSNDPNDDIWVNISHQLSSMEQAGVNIKTNVEEKIISYGKN